MTVKEIYSIFQKCTGVTTDSRKCGPGLMFFALKGERFDGNEFVRGALEQGCPYAVMDNAGLYDAQDSRMILVDNVLSTLQQVAALHRRTLGTPVIGITGTNGKTTTKELTNAVMSTTYNVLCTQGNLNNSIGVPLTVLGLKPEHEYAIVEMGASHPGDIKELVEVSQPDFGLITNVGKAHLLGFGSFEGVKRTKGELYDWLREHDGTAFVNRDNEHLQQMCKGLPLIEYGKPGHDGLLVEGEVLECGTPRTDILFSDKRDSCAVMVKKKLGVPSEKKLALYAPTFRDDFEYSESYLDVMRLRQSLSARFGGEWEVLLKVHPMIAKKYSSEENGGIDVSWYEDTQELLCASDVMVTDYSSISWEFALLKRPVFIYAYDAEEYEASRTLFVPMEQWPFPIAVSNAELEKRVAEFDEGAYVRRVEAFQKDKGCFDCGRACQTVIRYIFSKGAKPLRDAE